MKKRTLISKYFTQGGMRCRELFTFLRGLRGLNIIGGEVCEFTPEYDSNEVTAHACAQGAYEIMCLALDKYDPAEVLMDNK